MRFRWFFLGYLLMFSIPAGKTDIILLPALGYAMMLYATLRLCKYEKEFDRAKVILYAAIPIGIILLGLETYLTFVGENAIAAVKTLHTCFKWADELIEMAIMFFVYVGVRKMGDKTEIPALVKHSSRNMAIMFVYLLTEVAISLLYSFAPDLFKNFSLILIYPFVIGFLWRVLNLWMLFTCFLGIADTKEEEARERKEAEKEKAKKRR